MINALLAVKKGMTSGYDARGRRVGATILEIKPSFVSQIKTADSKNGYDAVQLGVILRKSTKKPQLGHAKKAGIDQNLTHFKEIKIKKMRTASQNKLSTQAESSLDSVQLGQEIKLGQVFFVGDSVKVTGTSKGKGFQGGVRRHGFHGGPKTHGQSDRHRAPGSIGSGTTPGRVLKGKSMAGHMGMQQVSYTGLEIISIDKTNNLLTVKGAIPGPVEGLVIVEKQGRTKGYTPPPEEKEEEGEEEKEQELKDDNEKKEVLDDFAVKTESEEQVKSESVQNEKGEEK